MSEPAIYTFAHKNTVVLQLPNQYAVMSIAGAHDLIMGLCTAIENAQGHQDVMDGKICPRCKARNVTPKHVCKRVKK